MKKIKIYTNTTGTVIVKLLQEKNPKTVEAISSILPITAKANIWGNEIYFRIGVKVKLENSQQIVEKGDIAYWPPGEAFCIFFGLTPSSVGDEIRAASSVNVFGRILGNSEVFKKVKQGDTIHIEAFIE